MKLIITQAELEDMLPVLHEVAPKSRALEGFDFIEGRMLFRPRLAFGIRPELELEVIPDGEG